MSSEQSQLEQGIFQGRVLARLDSIDNKLDEKSKIEAANDIRIRNLEQWKFWVMGASAAFGFGGPIVMKYLFHV